MAVTPQVRIYTVREGLLDEWARHWKEEIAPLRLGFGLSPGGAWIDRERHHFIWEISDDGPETFAERNRQYWDAPKREAMALGPKDYLASTDVREVTWVYCPQPSSSPTESRCARRCSGVKVRKVRSRATHISSARLTKQFAVAAVDGDEERVEQGR